MIQAAQLRPAALLSAFHVPDARAAAGAPSAGLVRAASEREGLVVRLAMVWLLIVPLAAFWATQLRPPAEALLSVLPVVPRAGEPVVATLDLKHAAQAEGAAELPARYALYADGAVIVEGVSRLPAGAAKVVQLARRQPLDVGRQALFTARVERGGVTTEDVRSANGAAPGAGQGASIMAVSMASSMAFMASSVSFAAASSTVMNSMVSMAYYKASFVESTLFDAGLVMVLAMLTVGIFVEATGFVPPASGRGGRLAQGAVVLAHRFRLPLVALYVIFGGLVVTRLALLFGSAL
jgi:hypothetical protein